MGTYGFGIQRCLHAIAESCRDQLGFGFPRAVRPFDVSVLVLSPEDLKQRRCAQKCYNVLLKSGANVVLDDRAGRLLKQKAGLSDFYGVPTKIIIGRQELKEHILTIKTRGDDSTKTVPFSENAIRRLANE